MFLGRRGGCNRFWGIGRYLGFLCECFAFLFVLLVLCWCLGRIEQDPDFALRISCLFLLLHARISDLRSSTELLGAFV